MQALDLRRRDENLVERLRQRHILDHAAGELEGNRRAARLIDIGPQAREHEVEHPAEDAVIVEAGDLVDLGEERGLHRLAKPGAVRFLFLDVGIIAQGKEAREALRRSRIARKRIGDIDLTIGHADLTQIARVGAQDIRFARRDPGFGDEDVETV